MGFSLTRLLGFGDSTSATSQTSSQTTQTTNTQNTQGDGSQAFTNSTGNSLSQTSYNTTSDHDAIDQSYQFARAGLDLVSQSTQTSLNASNSAFTTGLGFAEHAIQGVFNTQESALKTATNSIKDAYSTAKAGEQKVLVGGALAVVAIVAVMAIRK